MDFDEAEEFVNRTFDFIETPDGKAIFESGRAQFLSKGTLLVMSMLPFGMEYALRLLYVMGYIEGMNNTSNIDVSAFDDFISDAFEGEE